MNLSSDARVEDDFEVNRRKFKSKKVMVLKHNEKFVLKCIHFF